MAERTLTQPTEYELREFLGDCGEPPGVIEAAARVIRGTRRGHLVLARIDVCWSAPGGTTRVQKFPRT